MNQKQKDWLTKYNITSLEGLAGRLEIMRPTITASFSEDRRIHEDRQMYFDFVYLMVNKEAVLNSFFRENNKREVATHLSFKEAKNILLEGASREGNVLFLYDLVNAETFEDLQKALDL
jgi:hypothetical protein